MSEKIRITPALTEQIAGAIRAGGYPYIAAEAFGVPKEMFDDWLERGNRKNAWEPWRTFAREVRKAAAHARLFAEIEGYKKNPKLWLVNGPGRESEQRPGWSVSGKPVEINVETINILEFPVVLELFQTVIKVLAPFPEARAAVALAMEEAQAKKAA